MLRFFTGCISLIVLVYLSVFSYQSERVRQDALYHKIYTPHQFAGTELKLGYLTVTRCSGDTAFAHDSNYSNKFVLLARDRLLLPTRVYSIAGRLKSDGAIVVQDHREHPYRIYKYIFSAFSIPFILFYLFKYLRFDVKNMGFYFRRENA